MIKRIILFIILIALIGYFIAAITVFNRPQENQICNQVEIIIEGEQENALINQDDVKDYLIRNKRYPAGQNLKEVNLMQLEQTLKKSHYIESVVCYKTATGDICIKVKPYQVLMHVISENGDDYYLDNSGRPIPKSSYFANKVVATGAITKEYAKKNLVSLGKTIQADEFWTQQIEQIHVSGKGEIELIPRVGEHAIIIGKPENIKAKLDNLKQFYRKGLNHVGWNKYSEINLEYKDQIICTKNKE